jgi:phosphoribosyl 1,2-cyclic phosphate phosphodiesterase
VSISITILGCGSSGGVPRIGNDWGNCDPENPKNLRTRCSILVTRSNGQGDETNVIIDTSPDMRNQLNAANVGRLDGVLFTHPHADHIHGIDDLRAIAMNTKKRVNVWADKPTSTMLLKRFSYCFETPPGSDYPPILTLNPLHHGQPMTVPGPAGSIEFLPFRVHHGRIDALGFRIGNVVYTPDVNGIPEESLIALENLDTWIVDALRRTPHPSHFSFQDTLDWLKRMEPARAFITNMHIDLDYNFVAENTPDNVWPCHDGLKIEL